MREIPEAVKEEEVDFSLEKELKIAKPPAGKLSHKIAEKYRGFLVYVSRTYRAMVPYLKGLHLTLDFWRADRDEDGWRVANTVDARLEVASEREKPTRYVPMAPRFTGDMKVLLEFFQRDTPPKIPVRPTETSAIYMVGGASGTGFGTTKWKHGSERIGATHGAWDESVRKKSSNFREAYNLVLGIEKMAKEGELKPGTELFVFTDNSTSERAFDKGTSKSLTLHALVVHLRKLQMEGQLFINFVWISGNRMINQGTDSLSRGDLTSGVMRGDAFLKRIPLNESVGERHDLFCPGSRKHYREKNGGNWGPRIGSTRRSKKNKESSFGRLRQPLPTSLWNNSVRFGTSTPTPVMCLFVLL
jgi:hypothetical protein